MIALLLSHNTLVTSNIGIPNILNLNLSANIFSMHILSAMNSLDKLEFSTVDFRLLCKITGAQSMNITNPVWYPLVFLYCAWEATTNTVELTGITLGEVKSTGICSFASLYFPLDASLLLLLKVFGSILGCCESK